MNLAASLFDALLAVTLVLLAARLLFGRDLFASAVLFVAFGLVLALVWIRLSAPDLALAEAAVGAGLTGALVLRAAGQIQPDHLPVPLRLWSSALVVVLAALLCLALVMTAFSTVLSGTGLLEVTRAQSLSLGLEQPVTAVVMVFRGYDTWLELSVLLTAVLALLGVEPAVHLARRGVPTEVDPLLGAFARLLLPLAVLAGGFLLWQGTRAPGGAFQGGALVAAALVLGFLAGMRVFRAIAGRASRLLIVGAFGLPLLLTLPALAAGKAMFSYPPGDPHGWLLVLEVATSLSVALALASLFTGAEPSESSSAQSSRTLSTPGEREG